MSPRHTMLSIFLATLAPAAFAQDHPFETDESRAPAFTVGATCLIQGATVHTATAPAEVMDVLVVDGQIRVIGVGLAIPDGASVIDGSGKHLAPGVVDCHSHTAIERGINEGSLSITAEVRILDSVDVDDVGLYRALAGGVTTIRQLHGSANAIGGQDAVLKLRWHAEKAEDLYFEGSQTGIKFALGENPKRAGGRFPNTRMGIESIYARAFERAREYRLEWETYEAAREAGKDPAPPRRDIRLDTLVGILEGKVHVHSHCYRTDGILMLVRMSQRFGFQIATLQHVLEGYKVAHELAEAQVPASAFADWWGYKMEAYDAIPQAPSLMHDAGVLTSINSDSDEMMRRLYEEAAKSVRYAGMDRVAALQLVTLHPAMQLGIGDRVGSIEAGKDADLVLMNGDPLSAFSRVEWTMVDGKIEFTRVDAFDLDVKPPDSEPFVLPDDPSLSGGLLPAAPEGTRRIALVGGTVHRVDDEPIEGGAVVMCGNMILQVGKNIEMTNDTDVIDVTGKHVWPGMISLNSRLGLHEIGAVRATDDTREGGGNQPDLRVTAALYADSAHIGVTRWNGVTRAQVAPAGRGPLQGQSAVIDLDGLTWEELLTVDRDMLHLAFPSRTIRSATDAEVVRTLGDYVHQRGHNHAIDGGHQSCFCMESGSMPRVQPVMIQDDKDGDEDWDKSESIRDLRELFTESREYHRLVRHAEDTNSMGPAFDPRMAALAPYALGERRIGMHARNAQQILDVLRFCEEEGLDIVLYAEREAWKVVDQIKASGVSVVLGPIWALPANHYEPYDAPFSTPAVLARAGVPFAIASMDHENERNLPFQAAKAVAFGLPKEEAVRAVTLYAARVLGLEHRLGSLTPGKHADVVVTSGHLLEIDSPIEMMWIDGQPVDHEDNRHVDLYKKFDKRLKRLQGEDR
jgi:imidazolonepropionase-like amidohydrolase